VPPNNPGPPTRVTTGTRVERACGIKEGVGLATWRALLRMKEWSAGPLILIAGEKLKTARDVPGDPKFYCD
jgi:hypothetical protein